jgi:hypothetical protein
MNYFYEHDRVIRIRRIVSYTDADGLIEPLIADPTQISILEWEIISGLIGLFTNVLHNASWSLYFKYPTALRSGRYIFPVLLVLHTTPEDLQATQTALLRHADLWLRGRYMFIERINIKVVTRTDIEANRNLQFLIKIIYYRVAGDAIESSFANFYIGRDSIHLLPQIPARTEALLHAARKATADTLGAHIHYTIRLLLRAAFELVSEKERFFTRDVTTCSEAFCRHYPEYTVLSGTLLSYLTTPAYTLTSLLRSVTEFENLLTNEYQKIINAENHAIGKN